MDSPERNQIGSASFSKFEDSPVFSYINNLSPIKPVKCIHITQSFNSLNFATLPSIFTSPHTNSHKESRFLRRHNNGRSKREFSSEDGNNSTLQRENFKSEVSIDDAFVDPHSEKSSELATELKQTLKYDCGSPDCGLSSDSCVIEPSKGKDVIQRHEGTAYHWDTMISDAADLLIFNSPNGSEAIRLAQRPLDGVMGFSTSLMSQYVPNDNNLMQDLQTDVLISSIEEHDSKAFGLKEAEQAVDNKRVSITHCGLRRRCLDFETVISRTKTLDNGSNCNSSLLSQSDEMVAPNNKLPSTLPFGSDSSCRVLPRIGLHLNALAAISKNSNNVDSESFSYGRQLNLPHTIHQESLSISVSCERDMDPAENGIQLEEDTSFNQNSPKRKRRRLDNAGEIEGCKRCNCKKSKCLKLYCECFAAGVYCMEPCSCQECFNKPIHEDTVLATRKQIESRNPIAFAPKVIRNYDSRTEIIRDEQSKTPASAWHKRGCNCKKSGCLKKYCECYQGGVGCSAGCRCEGCKNAFGRKDDAITGIRTKQEQEDIEACRKSGAGKALQGIEVPNNEEQNLPITPLHLCGTMVQFPFSSRSKPPRFSFLNVGSPSGLYASHKLQNQNILQSETKSEKHMQMDSEDEIPEILCLDCSPGTTIKTSSPNSKRVTPPQPGFGSSTVPRIGRKLILRSIPSFPSFTPRD